MRLILQKNTKLLTRLDWLGVLCIVVNLFLIGFIILFQKNLPPQVPLYYGLPVAEDQLAPKILLIIPGLVSLIIILLNALLNKIVKEDFLQKTLISVSILVTLLSSITIIKIIFLVGNFK